jgi:hypothetical protein
MASNDENNDGNGESVPRFKVDMTPLLMLDVPEECEAGVRAALDVLSINAKILSDAIHRLRDQEVWME